MSVAQQIFDINEIAHRAEVLPGSVKRLEIYAGFITSMNQRGILQLVINRKEDGKFDQRQIAYAHRLRGDYTVVARPSNETFYISSNNVELNGSPFLTPTMDFYGGGVSQLPKSTDELVNRLVNAEKLVEQLQRENDELREELEQFETNSGRFAHSLGQVWQQFIEPRIFGTQAAAPMQGTQNKNMAQQVTEQQMHDALTNIVETFGADWIVRFSAKIQAEPNVVSQIKTFFP